MIYFKQFLCGFTCFILTLFSIGWGITLLTYFACLDQMDIMGDKPSSEDVKIFCIFFFGGGGLLTLFWWLWYHLSVKKSNVFETLNNSLEGGHNKHPN